MARVNWRGVTVDSRTAAMLNEVDRLTPGMSTPDPYDGIPTYEPNPDFVDDDTQPLPNPFEDDPE